MSRTLFLTALLLGLVPAYALASADDGHADFLVGIKYREEGQLDLAVELLTKARSESQSSEERNAITAELGVTLLQAHRYAEAGPLLTEAYQNSSGALRARRAIDLGDLAYALNHRDEARSYFTEAQQAAGPDSAIALAASLNAARLEKSRNKLDALRRLLPQVLELADSEAKGTLLVNLGHQARMLGKPGAATAYEALSHARDLSYSKGNTHLAVESLSELAGLYEDQDRFSESLMVTLQALRLLDAPVKHGQATLLVALEWRQARLLQHAGDPVGALTSLRRASNQLEAIRQDLPIDDEDGVSTFLSLIEPIERSEAALMLQTSEKASASARGAALEEAVDLIERLHQAEMQDFLGDRCTVEVVQGPATALEPKTAILYYLVLDDHIEILLRTDRGIERRTVSVARAKVQAAAARFEAALRDDDPQYRFSAEQFYDWLLRPVAAELKKNAVNTVVEVSDSQLRGVPLAALYDGHHFAVEQFSIGSVVGITMTRMAPLSSDSSRYLVTGLSKPGPVVAKLDAMREQLNTRAALPSTDGSPAQLARAESTPETTPPVTTRAMRMTRSTAGLSPEDEARELALPGAGREVSNLGKLLPGTELLDSQFTLNAFKTAIATGHYQVLHIASHGYFGGSADTSFIMTYDELLTMSQLQGLLTGQRTTHENSIDLLTLSACETAEGNERAPLGIAGAAIKARAHSIVGSLWAVDDDSARRFMEQFYRGILVDHLSRAEAVRQAQLSLIADANTSRPFFWAPFTLIGGWR